MVRYAIVGSNGAVVNVVHWDGASTWQPPAGTSAVASAVARIGDTYSNGQFISPEPPVFAPTAEDVARERDRRLALGFDYDFGDGRGVHRIGTTEADLRGWSEVSTYAGALLDSGDTTTRIAIATDTGACEMTAAEWRAVEIAAAQFRQPIWARSFVLMQTLPMDYTADAHWA